MDKSWLAASGVAKAQRVNWFPKRGHPQSENSPAVQSQQYRYESGEVRTINKYCGGMKAS